MPFRFMGSVVNRLEEGAIALLLAVMTVLTFSQVVARYVFNTGATWALEATEWLFAWLIFLGMSYGVKIGAHIGVDALVRLFPPMVQRVIGLLGVLACIGYAGIVLYGSWNYIKMVHMIGIEGEDIAIPLWIPSSILIIGFALLGLRFLQVFWKILTGQQLRLNLADEVKEAVKLEEERL